MCFASTQEIRKREEGEGRGQAGGACLKQFRNKKYASTCKIGHLYYSSLHNSYSVVDFSSSQYQSSFQEIRVRSRHYLFEGQEGIECGTGEGSNRRLPAKDVLQKQGYVWDWHLPSRLWREGSKTLWTCHSLPNLQTGALHTTLCTTNNILTLLTKTASPIWKRNIWCTLHPCCKLFTKHQFLERRAKGQLYQVIVRTIYKVSLCSYLICPKRKREVQGWVRMIPVKSITDHTFGIQQLEKEAESLHCYAKSSGMHETK